MDIKFEKTGENLGKITVNVVEADYAEKVTKELKEFGKTHTVPGFRKGHMNIAQLRKRFGRQVKSDVLNDVVYRAVIDYIRENKINILGQPLAAEVKEINIADKDFTFVYDCALAPDLNIVLDKSVSLPFYNIEVTDEMIDEQSKMLRERFGAQVPGEEVDAKAVVKGSIMELAEDGTVRTDENAIQVISGIVAPFLFHSEEQKEKFLGRHIGDKVVFNPYATCSGNPAELASMLNIDKEKAADVKSDFEFAISEITVVKPAELGEDFYNDVFGKDKVHNEEEYRAALRNMIASQLAPNSIMYFNSDARQYLMNTYGKDMTFDEAFLKRWLLAVNKDLTAEQLDKDFEAMLPGMKWEIISGDVCEKLGVKVEEADVLARAVALARQQLMNYGMYNMDEETVTDMGKRILADKNYRRQITNEVEELKMFDAIRHAITLDEKNVTIDEFKDMVAKANEEAPAENVAE